MANRAPRLYYTRDNVQHVCRRNAGTEIAGLVRKLKSGLRGSRCMYSIPARVDDLVRGEWMVAHGRVGVRRECECVCLNRIEAMAASSGVFVFVSAQRLSCVSAWAARLTRVGPSAFVRLWLRKASWIEFCLPCSNTLLSVQTA